MRRPVMLRTVQDTKTTKSIPNGGMPLRRGVRPEPDVFVRLSQLARDKHRLLGEEHFWRRKLQRVTKRLAEIDSQMEQLNREKPKVRDSG